MILSGDAAEGALIGPEKARAMPPGRGLFVHRGRPGVVVQTAFARPGGETGRPAAEVDDPEYLIQGRRRS